MRTFAAVARTPSQDTGTKSLPGHLPVTKAWPSGAVRRIVPVTVGYVGFACSSPRGARLELSRKRRHVPTSLYCQRVFHRLRRGGRVPIIMPAVKNVVRLLDPFNCIFIN